MLVGDYLLWNSLVTLKWRELEVYCRHGYSWAPFFWHQSVFVPGRKNWAELPDAEAFVTNQQLIGLFTYLFV